MLPTFVGAFPQTTNPPQSAAAGELEPEVIITGSVSEPSTKI